MSLTLDATWGGSGSNCYADLADAASHFEASLSQAAWTAVTTPTQMVALVEATRDIDGFRWAGQRWDDYQALKFPTVLHDLFPYGSKVPIASGGDLSPWHAEQKKRVKRACCEQALFKVLLQADGSDELLRLQDLGVESASDSLPNVSASHSFDGGGGLRLSSSAWRELSKYRRSGRRIFMGDDLEGREEGDAW